ncbi:hypothetical protein [Catenulispora pinisilvae]|uniref:hypothetical protein n=1 Tax=Catenulispora pinisilvae TaxID=2705253 RepID=UPI0018918075|nr:hypothetical protein [Catenulispora pinisilvae]
MTVTETRWHKVRCDCWLVTAAAASAGVPDGRTIGIEFPGCSALPAWCRLRQSERWFNLDRILAVEPVEASET